MGYYTAFNLEVLKGDEELIQEFRNECEGAQYAIDENGDTENNCKWYDFDKDLREFSKKHPKVIFKLHGEGEENGDLWDAYFKDGKMQMCKAVITYPDYNESQLK